MRRSQFLAVAGLLALGLASPLRAATIVERIRAAEQATYNLDEKAELAALEALRGEALASPSLAARDKAAAERLYGQALDAADKVDEAGQAYARGIALLQGAGDVENDVMARLLLGRGSILQRQGQIAEGRPVVEAARALVIRLHGNNAPELLPYEGELGLMDYLEAKLADAIAHYRAALSHGPPLPGDQAFHATANLDLAVFEARYGDEVEQMAHTQQALVEAKQWLPPSHGSWGMVYSNLGSFMTGWGRFDEAEPFAEKAVAYNLERFGKDSFEYGNALRQLATLRLRQGRLEEAQREFEAALPPLRDPKADNVNRFVEADAYRGLARLALARHDPAGAEKALAAAFESLERNKVRNGFGAMLHYELALAQTMGGHYPEALASVEVALGQLGKIRAPWEADRVNAEVLRARILARMGRQAEGVEAARTIAHTMRSRLEDPRIGAAGRRAVATDYRVNFARLAEIMAGAGRGEEAFALAQLASFSELAASSLALGARLSEADPAAAAHVRTLQELQIRYDHAERERNFAIGRGGPELAALEARVAALRAALDDEIAAVDRLFPDYRRLTTPRQQPLAAAVADLPPGEALMLPVQTDDRLTVLVITRRGLSIGSAALDSAAQLAAVRTLRRGLESGGDHFDLAAAWQLGRALFNPGVVKALSGVREIALVGAGPLMTLPTGLLLTAPPRPGGLAGQPYAIRRYGFSVRPVPGGVEALARRDTGAFLGVGAPLLGPARDMLRGGQPGTAMALMRGGSGDAEALRQLPSLPATAGELQAMAAALPAATHRVLTGAAATEAALRAEPLDRYGVIAFATHGLVSGELRGLTEPALVLTPPADAQVNPQNDGLLTASEAAGLKLKARWVILSACNTGAAVENGAGGYSALARGFIEAGADSLLVSMWPLRDDAAARLTVDTVRFHAQGASQAAALRRATLRLMADRRVPDSANPAVWAPFSLVRR